MDFNFSTDRLRVNQFSEKGIRSYEYFTRQIIDILSSEVTKALPEGWQNITSIDKAKHWIKERDEESTVLLIHRVVDSELIGFIFLYPITAEDNLVDLRFGYLLSKTEWGKGLGTEVVKGIVDTCIAQGNIRSISGGVEVDNIGSIKVLEKCGFQALDQEEGMEHIIFYEKQFLD